MVYSTLSILTGFLSVCLSVWLAGWLSIWLAGSLSSPSPSPSLCLSVWLAGWFPSLSISIPQPTPCTNRLLGVSTNATGHHSSSSSSTSTTAVSTAGRLALMAVWTYLDTTDRVLVNVNAQECPISGRVQGRRGMWEWDVLTASSTSRSSTNSRDSLRQKGKKKKKRTRQTGTVVRNSGLSGFVLNLHALPIACHPKSVVLVDHRGTRAAFGGGPSTSHPPSHPLTASKPTLPKPGT